MAQPEPVRHESFPIAQLDLVEEIRQLRASPIQHGHVAKAVLHERDLRIVLMILQRGATIPRHHAKGSIVIQALDGRVIVSLLESTFDLGSGQVLAIAPEIAHAVVAIEDSAIMLMIAHPAAR